MSAQAVRLTEVDIDNALTGEHLGVVFQPIFDLASGHFARMEVFIRWDHPGLGSLPPGAFISFFEAQGRMGDLTRYVIRRSLREYVSWRGTSGPGLSVNLAQSDLVDETFPAALGELLAEAGAPASLLTLECPPLPKQLSPGQGEELLARLGETGCPLAAEVRGALPPELVEADPFPFAELKVGGATILRFAKADAAGREVAEAVVRLAEEKGARVVAVGIEDAESAQALKALGFTAGQGKLLSGATSLQAFSAQTINEVRTTLGMDPLSQDALAEVVGRKPVEPLVLSEPAENGGEEVAEPAEAREPAEAADPTAEAIARLKARKIAAKKLAIRKAQEVKQAEAARATAEAEIAAARAASETARRLQERLSQQLETADQPGEPAPLDDGDDEEAGLLLSDDLAQVALGIAKAPSFAEGIRLDGYGATASDGETHADRAMAGALAPTQEPGVREGARAPQSFTTMAAAIHHILDELPVPELSKPDLILSASKPLGPGAVQTIEPTPPPGSTTLEADRSPADLLDDAVAAAPTLAADTCDGGADEVVCEEAAALIGKIGRTRAKKNLLTRKYRITHFWPRSWVRALRRHKAPRARREAPSMNASAA